MKLIKELDDTERSDIKKSHRNHELFKTHIEIVLNAVYCFQVHIFADDYSKILIHSCLPNIIENTPYQPLSDAITYIRANPEFLNTSTYGCLNGKQVQHYFNLLDESEERLQASFVNMGDCFMLDKAKSLDSTRIEITDGMHRLVAYGLVTDMKASLFPIPLYFGTNKSSYTRDDDRS